MKHKSTTGRLIWLATTALMLMAMIPAAFAASPDTASMQPSAVCYPTAVTQSDDGGEIRKMYDLSPEADPAGIPRSDFERAGYHYTLIELLKQELPEYESRQHTETVTVSSKSKDMATVLSLLPQEREFITDDGLSGVLSLRLDSVKVAVAGYGSSTKELTASRTYPGLSNQDTSPIPKSVEEDGHTLTLSTVNWQRDGEDGSEQYTAVAAYTGSTTNSYIKGYTVTAEYTGTVSRINLNRVRYVAIFEGKALPTEDVEDTPLSNTGNNTASPAATETSLPSTPLIVGIPVLAGLCLMGWLIHKCRKG